MSHGDIRDPIAVNTAVGQTDRVVHCAAQVQIGWQGLELQRAINVEGTRNVADAALKNHVRMVHVSSIDTFGAGSPDHPSMNTPRPPARFPAPTWSPMRSRANRARSRAQGLDAVIVNPGFMLGPWDWKPSSGRILLKVANGWALVVLPGTNSYCDVRDVAAASSRHWKKPPWRPLHSGR